MNNRIVIGEDLFEFSSDEIMSMSSVEEQSLDGAELPFDTMTAVVRFNPVESESDLRLVPYGTAVSYFDGTNLKGRFYVDTITRQTKYEYQLYCVSAIGLLDKSYHSGDIYFGTDAARLIIEIVGNVASAHVLAPFGDEKVYGWLPRDTCRNNLQQLLFALNGKVYCGSNGDLYFDYLNDAAANYEYEIDDDSVYDQGAEEYPKQASKCTITEHSFYYNASVEPVLLFDNSSGSNASAQWVNFDNAPVNKTTLTADGDISILTSCANGAVITGSGKIYGKPYIHSTYEVTKISGLETDYEITVKDATLVSIANSENVANRILAYYTTGTKVTAGIVYNNEKCGRKYTLKDAFSETRTGYIAKIAKTLSSFMKADCEIVSLENLGAKGNNYSRYSLLTGNGYFTVPDNVKRVRAVIIGGGSGGNSGTAGYAGEEKTGGKGGKAGAGGKGGNVYIVDIDVSPGAQIPYASGAGGRGGSLTGKLEDGNPGSEGGDTTFSGYSSALGGPVATGIKCLFLDSVSVFACDGHSGADGGKGGSANSAYAEDGESVELTFTNPDGTITAYAKSGGLRGKSQISKTVGASNVTITGGGGGGATATGNGTAGSDSSYTTQNAGMAGYVTLINAKDGNGGAGSTPQKAPNGKYYGCGGDGGHGGGGGGGSGQTIGNNVFYYSEYAPYDGTFYYGEKISEQKGSIGSGGYGGAGGDGASGCIIVYY